MKITKVAALLGPWLLAMSSAAHPASGEMTPYVEASYAWPKLESSGLSATTGATVIRAGVNFNQYWALEAVGARLDLVLRNPAPTACTRRLI